MRIARNHIIKINTLQINTLTPNSMESFIVTYRWFMITQWRIICHTLRTQKWASERV
jgi:hypothetical protein